MLCPTCGAMHDQADPVACPNCGRRLQEWILVTDPTARAEEIGRVLRSAGTVDRPVARAGFFLLGSVFLSLGLVMAVLLVLSLTQAGERGDAANLGYAVLMGGGMAVLFTAIGFTVLRRLMKRRRHPKDDR